MRGQNNKTLIVFSKLINKLFVGKTIEKNTFSYEFISSSINSYDYDRVDIKINVITPKKGQSYFKGVFITDVKEIISKVETFIGKKLYNLYFYVDGKKCEDVFISDEDERKIFENLSKIDQINIFSNNIRFKSKVSFKEPTYYPWYQNSQEGPEINFNYDIYDITVNGERPGPNFGKDDKKLSILSQNINELLIESDRFRDDVSESVINVLEPSMRILDDYDTYYSIYYYIDKIDGIKASDNVWGDFTYDLFS
jgi:hypothetical protein